MAPAALWTEVRLSQLPALTVRRGAIHSPKPLSDCQPASGQLKQTSGIVPVDAVTSKENKLGRLFRVRSTLSAIVLILVTWFLIKIYPLFGNNILKNRACAGSKPTARLIFLLLCFSFVHSVVRFSITYYALVNTEADGVKMLVLYSTTATGTSRDLVLFVLQVEALHQNEEHLDLAGNWKPWWAFPMGE